MNDERKLRSDIIDDFECLKSDLDILIDCYKDKAKKCIDENDHKGMLWASDKWESLFRYKQKVEGMLDEFYSLFVEEQNDKDELHNFSFTEPLQIKLFNNYFDVNRKWREALIIVCEELIKRHPDKFRTFDKNDAFKGKKRSFFSYNPDELREAYQLSNGLYVEMNLSANSIVRICYNILEQCGYNSDELRFKVENKRRNSAHDNV